MLNRMVDAAQDEGRCTGRWTGSWELDETLKKTLDAAEDDAEDVGIHRGRWTLRGHWRLQKTLYAAEDGAKDTAAMEDTAENAAEDFDGDIEDAKRSEDPGRCRGRYTPPRMLQRM